MTRYKLYTQLCEIERQYSIMLSKEGFNIIELMMDTHLYLLYKEASRGENLALGVTSEDLSNYEQFKSTIRRLVVDIQKYSSPRYDLFSDFFSDSTILWRTIDSPMGPVIERLLDAVACLSSNSLSSMSMILYDLETDLWDIAFNKYNQYEFEGIKAFITIAMIDLRNRISQSTLDKYNSSLVYLEYLEIEPCDEYNYIPNIGHILNLIGESVLLISMDYDFENKNQWPFTDESIIDHMIKKIDIIGFKPNIAKKLKLLGLSEYKNIPLKRLNYLLILKTILSLEKANQLGGGDLYG